MKAKKVNFSSIDEYIASFPEDVQKIMEQLRKTIKAAAPKAGEKISYNMPTFTIEWYIPGLLCRVENSYCVLWRAQRKCGIQRGSVSL